MKIQRIAALVFAVALGLPVTGHAPSVRAQESAATAEPPPPDPWTIPPDAFASRVEFGAAKLSPDGKRFAYTRRADGKFWLSIVNADTLQTVRDVSLGVEENFNWFRWAGSERVLTSRMASAVTRYYSASFSRLVAYDISTAEWHYIGFEKQALEGDDVLFVDPSGDHIVLSVSRTIGVAPEVWRFPLDGSGEANASLLQERDRDIDEWWADNTGVVRLGMGFTRGSSVIIYYRSGPDEEFRRITKLKSKDDELDNWDVISLIAGSDTGYAMVDGDDGKRILRELDYTSGELGAVFHEEEGWSLDSVTVDSRQKPIGVHFTNDGPQSVWLDPDLQNTQALLERTLGGSVRIISQSTDRSRMIVMHSGAADPGAVYIFTPAERRLELYRNLRPQLDIRALSEPKAVSYTARDGTPIRAFLTLPASRKGKGSLPLIIMPHGGPFGIRDSLVYDDWVQIMASRGYAVLQPNYRGSGGYGKAFETLGEGEIGFGMQDDLDDAMDWAVSEGLADADKVCLVGASYGGYAALWGVIRNPERYRCAVSFAGVTDWGNMLDYDRDYIPRRYYREYKDRVKGSDNKRDLDDASPLRRAKDISRPILVVHGTADKRVPVSQLHDFVKAARGATPALETLELNDGHSFAKEENELAFYRALLAFLHKHNPAGPLPTDAAEDDLSATGG